MIRYQISNSDPEVLVGVVGRGSTGNGSTSSSTSRSSYFINRIKIITTIPCYYRCGGWWQKSWCYSKYLININCYSCGTVVVATFLWSIQNYNFVPTCTYYLLDLIKIAAGPLQLTVQQGDQPVRDVGILDGRPLQYGAGPPMTSGDKQTEVLTRANQSRLVVVSVKNHKAGVSSNVWNKKDKIW